MRTDSTVLVYLCAVLRNLDIDKCSRNPCRVMKARHGYYTVCICYNKKTRPSMRFKL